MFVGDFASSAMSTGLHNILRLWKLKQNLPDRAADFRAAMKAAGAYTDDNADFMGVWCDLMAIGALGTFPEGARTHDAVLDGENEHLVELLEREAASGGPRPAPSRKVYEHPGNFSEEEECVDDEEGGGLGVLREERLEDPFGD
jgi:hypothetical protein